MRFPPPEVIASWPARNAINPETRGPGLVITEVIIISLALICLVLRLYVRLFIIRRSGWDDWLMVGAAVFGLGVTICVILASQEYGWDIHVWDLSFEQIVQGRQVSIAAQTLFLFASGLAKLSILASYLRIAPMSSTFRRLSLITIWLVVAAMFIFLVVLWAQCMPAVSYWDIFESGRDCIEEGPPLMAQTTLTVIADFVIFVLPLPTLFGLSLPFTQRIVLMVLFGMGVVVVIAGCMRTYWVHYVVDETFDVTWEGFDLWIWTAVEVNLGVITGCIPVLKPLFYTPSIVKDSSYGRSTGKSHSIGLSTLKSTRIGEIIKKNVPSQDREKGVNIGATFLRLKTPPGSPRPSLDSPTQVYGGKSWLHNS